MYIIEQCVNMPLYKTKDCIQYMNDGNIYRKKENIIIENMLDIYVNKIKIKSINCTPKEMAMLVLGYLISTAYIKTADKIESLIIDEEGKRAYVTLKEDFVQIENDLHKYIQRETIKISCECAFNAINQFAKDELLYKFTHGTHSCLVIKEGKVEYVCEDISRRNALDKALGMLIYNKIDVSKCIIYISSRVQEDMVCKIVRCGIPILICKSVPTEAAISKAKENSICLLCKAKDKFYQIYS